MHREMLDDRAEGEGREEDQCRPSITITPTTRPTNSGLSVGKVPAETGTIFLRTSEPATASIGTIIRKRPMSIARPRWSL